MLENVTLETFKPYENDSFKVSGPNTDGINMKLVSVTAAKSHSSSPRAPFSLMFESSENTVRPQGCYAFTHEKFGTLEIFIVPVGRATRGIQYHAVFN